MKHLLIVTWIALYPGNYDITKKFEVKSLEACEELKKEQRAYISKVVKAKSNYIDYWVIDATHKLHSMECK